MGFKFELFWLPVSWRSSVFLHICTDWIAPILFSLTWIYFMILLGDRLAKTTDILLESSSSISAHYMIFYGVCALVMLISFLIPLLTPVVGVLAFASLTFRGLTSKVSWNELDPKTQKFVKTLTMLVNIPMLFCVILVVPELIGLSINFFTSFWDKWLDILYYVMKALGAALPVGNFILLYQNAVSEVEGRGKTSQKNTLGVTMIEIVIAGFLFFLQMVPIEFVNLLYYIGAIFWVLTLISNFIQGRNARKRSGKTAKAPQNPFTLIMYGIFWAATMIFGSDKFHYSEWVRYVVVGGAAFIFIIYFLLAFIGHPDLEEE
ncbi:MAG: hypothetical protein ACTSUI_04705 [Promethearchaeota archaeon]